MRTGFRPLDRAALLICLTTLAPLLGGCVVYTNAKDAPALGGPGLFSSSQPNPVPSETMRPPQRPVYRSDLQAQYDVYAPRTQSNPPPPRNLAQIAPPKPPAPTAKPPQTLAAKPKVEAPLPKPTSPTDQVIEVQAGETLEVLSKRHGVSISAILTANTMNSLSISPGQKLIIPAHAAPIRPVANAAVTPPTPPPAPSRKPEPPAPAPAPKTTVQNCGWSGCALVPARQPS